MKNYNIENVMNGNASADEVTALKATNYVKWIELLQYRKNNNSNRLLRSSVKDFVLDAVFEQEE